MFMVIDGSSILVTNYYATLPKQILFEKDPEKKKLYYNKIMQTSTGIYTNAVYGMLKFILKLIKDQNPTHLAVVFDKTRNTFRRQIYPDYKGNRSETPQPLKEQFATSERLLEEIGIPVFYSDMYEADDLAGSIIKRFEGPGTPMYFVTKDQDYLQLVSDYTRGWMIQSTQEKADEMRAKYGMSEIKESLPTKVFEYTPMYVKSEYGIYPNQIPDLKAIVGDASDNIPGVKGVSSAAAILLSEYGTVENLYATVDGAESAKDEKALSTFWKQELGISRSPLKSLKEGKESAFLSKKLAMIKTDIEMPEDLEHFKLSINTDILKKELAKLEFKSLL